MDEETYLYYLDVQKVFYYLKKRLDDDNDIAQQLPYYWYLDGPVSDEVQSTVNRARDLGAVETEKSVDGGLKFKQAPEGPDLEFTGDSYTAAAAALERVLEEDYDIYADLEQKLGEVYEDAPYEFQRFFKFEVMDAVEEYDQGVPWHYSTEEISNLIGTAEAYLPVGDQFNEVNKLYSRFYTVAKRYLEVVDDDRHGSGTFNELAKSFWQLFCYRLRMVEHDPEYEDDLEGWESDYMMKKESFEAEIKQFREFVAQELEGNSDGPTDFQSPQESGWGKVVEGLQQDN
ncbi:hypothetical protein [Halobacterium rubrum]|uniref:hypothetical protein n=1 Tax=Halobacterium rubrum TaxID=1341552 RepID=UPI002455D978|nr:hypothetical protein [Halobacterium rubrum]MDH5020386.1 hypothetical protein [Halobacterium rubrum]